MILCRITLTRFDPKHWEGEHIEKDTFEILVLINFILSLFRSQMSLSSAAALTPQALQWLMTDNEDLPSTISPKFQAEI